MKDPKAIVSSANSALSGDWKIEYEGDKSSHTVYAMLTAHNGPVQLRKTLSQLTELGARHAEITEGSSVYVGFSREITVGKPNNNKAANAALSDGMKQRMHNKRSIFSDDELPDHAEPSAEKEKQKASKASTFIRIILFLVVWILVIGIVFAISRNEGPVYYEGV